jgi:hypothetical protein
MGLRVQEGQKMLLTNPAVGGATRLQVRVRSSRNGSFAVAFEFDCPTPQFWLIAFPLADRGLVETENQTPVFFEGRQYLPPETGPVSAGQPLLHFEG